MGESSKEPSVDSKFELIQSPCADWAWRYSLSYGPVDIFRTCQHGLVIVKGLVPFSGPPSNYCGPDFIAHIQRSSPQVMVFVWASLVFFPKAQIPMALNPFLVTGDGLSCVLGLSPSLGWEALAVIQGSMPIPGLLHRLFASTEMLEVLASKSAADPQRVTAILDSVSPMSLLLQSWFYRFALSTANPPRLLDLSRILFWLSILGFLPFLEGTLVNVLACII